jgi:sulfonate transport system substrate-binding protein
MLLVAAGCTGGTVTTAATTAAPDLSGVTLRVGDQAKLTQAEMQAAGADKTPYKVEWSAFTSGPPLLQAVAAGAIDLGGVGDAPPIFVAAGGADVKIVYATQTPEVNQGILVRPGSSITSVAGLRGKKVGVAQGSSANWVLLRALQASHLTTADIRIAYLQPPAAQAALNAGNIDAWAIWDPFSTVAESQGAKLIVSGRSMQIPGLGFEVTNSQALKDPAKTAAIHDFLRRLRTAQAWADTHVDVWAQTYSQLTKLAPAVATKVLGLTSVQPAKLNAGLITAEQAEADAFYATKLIPTQVDFAKVVDARFTDIANPTP